ncbi:MAG: VWA domain-containing protein, partial [Planctomycetota bacterium]
MRLTATLTANQACSGSLAFVHRGVVEKTAPVTLEAGKETRVSCEVNMTTAGRVTWTAELRCSPDHFPLNNTAACSIDVQGKARVLAIHRKPVRLRPLTRALRRQNIDLDVRSANGLPMELSGMLEFDAIMLADIPATSMTSRQMVNLKRYVSDFGGGLVMLGSENSFGLGGYFQTPVEEVLPIISRYEKEKEKPSLAMALVIDKSGSMSGVKIQLARAAAKAAVELLSARDQIAVVAFDGQPYVVARMASASYKDSIASSIDTIQAGGGTNMYPAMAVGRDMLSETSARLKHMIVLGDGHSSGGNFQGLAAEMADENITISTVALGNGADQALLSSIAEIGKGRYYMTLDPESVPRIFTKETMEASKSAIKEEPFLPVPMMKDSFLEGIDLGEAPYLLGYVMTKLKSSARPVLATETGDPLMAIGRYGLGQAIAFSSDASDRWAGEWLSWRAFGQFWAQTLRAVIRKESGQGIHITEDHSGANRRWWIRRLTPQGVPQPGVPWQAKVTEEGGLDRALNTEEIGYGLYRVSASLPQNAPF